MLSPKALLIILDAFSSRYLTPRLSPYLYNLSKKLFYTTIKPIFAYKGIGFTLRTGLPISSSGIWNDHIFKKRDMGRIKSILFKSFLKLIDTFSLEDYSNKVLRYVLFKLFREEYGTPHLIPTELIEHFSVVNIPNNDIKYEDIFTKLGKSGKKGTWIEPKFNILEESALNNAINKLQYFDLIVLKLNSLDRLGHRYGPLSEEVYSRVRYLDNIMHIHVEKALSKYPDLLLIIMSDHGMCPVRNIINIEQKLKRLPLQAGREYVVYIGTTLIHFWFLKKEARKHVENILQELDDYGKILEEEDLLSMELGRIDRRLYGEVIFALYEGNIFHPDFYYKRRPPKGMHGYPYCTWDNAIFISNHHPAGEVTFSNIPKIISKHLEVG